VKLRNPRKGVLTISCRIPRADGALIFRQFPIAPGAVADLDVESLPVQRKALSGRLVPVDAEGEAWLAALRSSTPPKPEPGLINPTVKQGKPRRGRQGE